MTLEQISHAILEENFRIKIKSLTMNSKTKNKLIDGLPPMFDDNSYGIFSVIFGIEIIIDDLFPDDIMVTNIPKSRFGIFPYLLEEKEK